MADGNRDIVKIFRDQETRLSYLEGAVANLLKLNGEIVKDLRLKERDKQIAALKKKIYRLESELKDYKGD